MAKLNPQIKDVNPVKNALVTKSNRLVEARYKLSLVEQKIIYAIISMIQPNDESFFTYRIKILDLAKICGFNTKTVYKQLEEVTRTLRSRVLTIKKVNSILQTGWISSAEYFETEGIVEFCLDWKLEPYLLQLKGEFTKMKMSELMSFKSQYTGRIYELAYQYKPIGQRKMSIEELREYLSLEEKEYILFGHLKAKIIEPAIKEINKNTSLLLSYTVVKTGRKITGIIFSIKSNTLANEACLGMDLFAGNSNEAPVNEILKAKSEASATWGKLKAAKRRQAVLDCPKCNGKGIIIYKIGETKEITTIICECCKE